MSVRNHTVLKARFIFILLVRRAILLLQCLSARLFVMLRYRGHTRWISIYS